MNIDELLENTESTDEYLKICEDQLKKIKYCCFSQTDLQIKYLLKMYNKLCKTSFMSNKNLLNYSINSSSRMIKQCSNVNFENTLQIINISERLVKLYLKKKKYYNCGKLYEDIRIYTNDNEIKLKYLIKASFYYKKIKSKFFYKISIYSILDLLQDKKDYEQMSLFLEELNEVCPSENNIKLILISSKLHDSLLYLYYVNKYQFDKDFPKDLILTNEKLEILRNVNYIKWNNFV